MNEDQTDFLVIISLILSIFAVVLNLLGFLK